MVYSTNKFNKIEFWTINLTAHVEYGPVTCVDLLVIFNVLQMYHFQTFEEDSHIYI